MCLAEADSYGVLGCLCGKASEDGENALKSWKKHRNRDLPSLEHAQSRYLYRTRENGFQRIDNCSQGCRWQQTEVR